MVGVVSVVVGCDRFTGILTYVPASYSCARQLIWFFHMVIGCYSYLILFVCISSTLGYSSMLS